MKSFVPLRITSRVLTGFFALFLFPLGLACLTPSFAQMAVPSVSIVATSKTARLLTITFVDYVDPNAGTNSESGSGSLSGVWGQAGGLGAVETNKAECYSVTGLQIGNSSLDYAVNPVNSELPDEFVLQSAKKAAETWNCASHKILFSNIDNSSLNTVEFFDFGSGWLVAQTSISFDGDTLEVLNFHVMLNTVYPFGDASIDPNVFDLQGILTHELGLVVGLGDIYDSQCQDATMYAYDSFGSVSRRTLAAPDLEGLRQIYGTVDNTPPQITCPANIVITAPNASGVVVSYPAPVASDSCPGVTVACLPPSGSVFPIGVTTVTCIATDAASNTNGCTFTIEVKTADSDQDGVADDRDPCPNTPLGSIIDSTGCSIVQLVPCEGPASGGKWKSHGQYVRTVVLTATDFLKANLITRRQWMEIVTRAARSKCGWNRRSDHDWDWDWHRNWDCDRDRDWGRGRNWDRD